MDRWREAGQQAMERWGEALEEMRAPSPGGEAREVRQQAMVERYVREHRGRPEAIRAFASQRVGPQRAEEEARRYQEAMEAMVGEQMGRGTIGGRHG